MLPQISSINWIFFFLFLTLVFLCFFTKISFRF